MAGLASPLSPPPLVPPGGRRAQRPRRRARKPSRRHGSGLWINCDMLLNRFKDHTTFATPRPSRQTIKSCRIPKYVYLCHAHCDTHGIWPKITHLVPEQNFIVASVIVSEGTSVPRFPRSNYLSRSTLEGQSAGRSTAAQQLRPHFFVVVVLQIGDVAALAPRPVLHRLRRQLLPLQRKKSGKSSS